MSAEKTCGACGGTHLTKFSGQSFPVGDVKVNGLSGLRCADCDEIYFDAKSQARFVAASDEAVLSQRKKEQAELARIRKKLKLTQRQAAALTGGGHNAFSRYERGEAQPVAAVTNLFKVLDRHPELLDEIRPD